MLNVRSACKPPISSSSTSVHRLFNAKGWDIIRAIKAINFRT